MIWRTAAMRTNLPSTNEGGTSGLVAIAALDAISEMCQRHAVADAPRNG
jgi:hypothetical protein